MPTEKISLDKIVDTHHLPRRKRIEAIKETIKKDGGVDLLSPINCEEMAGDYFIWDGSHRYVAAKELGYKSMWVDY